MKHQLKQIIIKSLLSLLASTLVQLTFAKQHNVKKEGYDLKCSCGHTERIDMLHPLKADNKMADHIEAKTKKRPRVLSDFTQKTSNSLEGSQK